ncbi:sensor histidine kinase [Streptomyces ipomoeae]|uniref:sensor histidine kinase n=1 Tax=Streptomyces ipomoeae TaxID=103232 RepID=UPI001FD0772B|nr:ATP-binding protein [Streptomyces ipomoeae]MDX2935407.1 histidine kinase [Streptomyces ipomoeae]
MSPRRSRRTAVVLAGVGAVFGAFVLVLVADDRHADSTSTVFSGAVGGLYLGAGLAARWRRPDNAVGLLMLLVGIGWFAEDLQISTDPAVHTVGLFLRSASSGFLIPLLLVFPDGRLRSRHDGEDGEGGETGSPVGAVVDRRAHPVAVAVVDRRAHPVTAAVVDRTLVAAGCAVAFVLVPVSVFFHASVTPNLLLLHPVRDLHEVVEAVQFVMSGAVVAVLVWRWATATPPARRALAPLLVVGVVGALASGLDGAFGSASESSHPPLITVAHLTVLLLPLTFLAGVWRVRLGRTAVAELLRRMPLASRAELREALAKALGDRSLQVGFPAPGGTGYVDVEGRPLSVPPGRQATDLERDGRRVGVLVHDPALREDRYVLEAVVSAAALELDNQALVAELRESRRRVIEAGDEQRREVERALHDGAQQKFINLGLRLRLARRRVDAWEAGGASGGSAGGVPGGGAGAVELAGMLDDALAMLEQGHAELRVAARGIHPVVLSEAGLVPALRSLASDLPLTVDIHAAGLPPLPEPIELTAYYVVKEAISNVLRHADAETVRVELRCEDGALRLSVTDDGVGGADPAGGGTGLLGLRHRVTAYDGELSVRGGPDGGTIVAVTLPTGGERKPPDEDGRDGSLDPGG